MCERGQDEPEDNGSAGGRILAAGWLGTLFLAIVLIAVLAIRFPEWWPPGAPIPPGAEAPARLTLSEIGNVLAGIFAPLAFLWLFVATMLQRKELELQRKELRETREELRRTAEANDNQARLMNESLEVSKKKSDFEYFAMCLYYAAIHWTKVEKFILIPIGIDGKNIIGFGSNITSEVYFENIASVDKIFLSINSNIIRFLRRKEQLECDYSSGNILKSLNELLEFLHMLEDIEKNYTLTENEMIVHRTKYLELPQILSQLRRIHAEALEVVRARAPKIYEENWAHLERSHGTTP